METEVGRLKFGWNPAWLWDRLEIEESLFEPAGGSQWGGWSWVCLSLMNVRWSMWVCESAEMCDSSRWTESMSGRFVWLCKRCADEPIWTFQTARNRSEHQANSIGNCKNFSCFRKGNSATSPIRSERGMAFSIFFIFDLRLSSGLLFLVLNHSHTYLPA